MYSTDGTKKVWNIIIGKKMDCVIMTDAEAMQVKMKFMPNVEMTDMTTLHNINPEMFHKAEREKELVKQEPRAYVLFDAVPVQYKTTWTFDSLMEM
jgi:hypothetical protein